MAEDTPPHRQPRLVALVFAGGGAGTLARWAVTTAVPHLDGVPVGTFAVNVVGAFVLGLLLERLARSGPDRGRRRALRLTLGTGFCGGFTTYSALGADTAGLLRSGLTGHALAYALGTVGVGLLAAGAGVVLGSRHDPGPG